jgi:hypothetical protein
MANDNNVELNARMIQNNLFQKLNSDLDRIVDYTIKYPYFDDSEYKQEYSRYLVSKIDGEKENALRYEAFAIMNFNFIEDLYTFYDGDSDKMGDFCAFREIIVDNKYYWQNMVNRREDGYSKIFDFVNATIEQDAAKEL